MSSLPLSLLSLPLASLLSSRSRPRFLTRASPTRAHSLILFLYLSFSSQCRVLPLHLPCHVSRGVPNATAPPLPQAVTPLCTSPPRRTSHLQPHAHVSSTALLRTIPIQRLLAPRVLSRAHPSDFSHFPPPRRSPPRGDFPPNPRALRSTVALKVFHPPSPLASQGEEALRPTPLPAGSCRTAGIERNGFAQKSPVCCRVQPARERVVTFQHWSFMLRVITLRAPHPVP